MHCDKLIAGICKDKTDISLRYVHQCKIEFYRTFESLT